MKRPSFSRTILPVLAGCGIVAAAAMVWAGQPDRERTTPVETPPVAPAGQSRSGTVSGAGLVEPSSELIEVGTDRAGVVTRVAVRPGDRVTRGQLLFAIDDRDARARVAELQSRIALADSRIESARVDVATAERLLRLYTSVEDPRAVAQVDVVDRRGGRDAAQARLAVARAERAQAVAELATARTEVALHEVRAPRSGEVLQVRVRAGEFATAGPGSGNAEPLMVIGETNPLHVRVDVDESEIGRADVGAAAIVSPRGDARRRVRAAYVRTEPLVVPKRSLTNSSTERVDVRVLQLIYALPPGVDGFTVGQQVDAFLPERGGRNAARPAAAAGEGAER